MTSERDIVRIDGSFGEGGGQILRSALSLSLVTGRPFELSNIRAGRTKPGLLRQHLTCMRAACEISGATAEGAELGSKKLVFHPAPVRAGDYHFAIGSAGSTMLVVQTVLVPLILTGERASVRVTGGTHNSAAPPFEFFEQVFASRLAEMGSPLEARIERAGFHPAGGGIVWVQTASDSKLGRLVVTERGAMRSVRGRVLSANIPPNVAHREASVLEAELGLARRDIAVDVVKSDGPGNAVMAHVDYEHARDVITAFGERGVRAEDVAARAAHDAKRYIDAGVPIGEHLADQLLLPMAVGGGGEFLTMDPSEHLRTNAWLIGRFLAEDAVTLHAESAHVTRVIVKASGRARA